MRSFPFRFIILRSQQLFKPNSSLQKLMFSRTIKFHYSQEINQNNNDSTNQSQNKTENKTIDIQPSQMIDLFQQLISLRKLEPNENNQEKIITTLDQLVPYIENFNAHQLEYFLLLTNEMIIIEHELTDKLYEQTKQLLYSQQSNFNQSLRILSLLTENPLKEEQLEIFIKFLFTILEMPYLDASTLGQAIYVYGLIVKQYEIESADFYQSITRHLKRIDQDYDEIMEKGKKDSQFINLTQQDLKQLALGLFLGGSKTPELQKYIGIKAQSIFIEIQNLIVISKYLLNQETINSEFLNFFKQELEKSKDKLLTDDLLQLMIIARSMKQKDSEILEFIIKEFLRKQSQFSLGDKAFIYQKMAQVQCQNQELWIQFEQDIKEITNNCDCFDACLMFYCIFDIFDLLKPECQEFIFNYIIGKQKEIDPEMKELLLQKLQEKGIVTEKEIEESKKLS